MKAVIQRVSRAEVAVDGAVVGQIGLGLLVYVGVAVGDGPDQARKLAQKTAAMRIFEDDQGKMNLAAADVGGAILAIPNFTLQANATKGNRPAFTAAAAPQQAEALYDIFAVTLQQAGIEVAKGSFGAHMIITSVADGPVNIVLDIAPSSGKEAAAT